MVARPVPRRLTWAVETLAPEPADHVLEVGCGGGVAAGLVCERLNGGRLLAIDRSQVMIDRAVARNAGYVAAGTAEFRTTGLADLDVGDARFDKVFAVNVNLFWLDAATSLAVIRELLAPGGALFLFYEPPAPRLDEITGKLTANLHAAGYAVSRVITDVGASSPLLAVVARPVLRFSG